MHVKINRSLATVALTLSIVTLSGVLYGALAAWMALQDVQQGLAELGSTLGGTEAPAPAELPSSEWYTDQYGNACFMDPVTYEETCEPQVTE
jgi:hypothetical protein